MNEQLVYTEETRENGVRIYTKNNKQYISLTTLLSRYEDKTHLINWTNRVGAEEAKLIGKTAANRGTVAHNHIEHFYGLCDDSSIAEFNENSEPIYNKYATTAINGFYGHVEPIEVEQVVFYEHPTGARVAGRYDALLNMPQGLFKYKDSDELVLGGKVVADLKTKDKTPRFDKLDFIFKHLLQIAAYSKIISLTTEHLVTGAVVVYAVVLKTKEHCKVIYLDSEQIDFFWGLVESLLLDFFRIKPLTLTWHEMIALTYCSFDYENEMLIDYSPREILYVSDTGLSRDITNVWDS